MAKSSKGAKFEREICKALSLWWSEGKRDDIFWRTPGSGARATTRRKKGKHTADSTADVMSSHEDGKPFTKVCLSEIKRGYSDKHKIVKNKKSGKLGIRKTKGGLDFLTIVDKLEKAKEPQVLEWWKKVEQERISTGRKFSFIIFQRDQKRPCIVMNKKLYNHLSKHNGKFNCRNIVVNFNPKERIPTLYILKLDDFLNWCNPKCFLDKLPRIIKRRKSI